MTDFLTGVLCLRIGKTGVLRSLLNVLGDVIYRSGQLFNGRSLLGSALGKPLCTGTDLLGTRVDLYRTLLNLRHGSGKVGGNVVNGIEERTICTAIVFFILHFHIEITLCKLAELLGKVGYDGTDSVYHIIHSMHKRTDFVVVLVGEIHGEISGRQLFARFRNLL